MCAKSQFFWKQVITRNQEKFGFLQKFVMIYNSSRERQFWFINCSYGVYSFYKQQDVLGRTISPTFPTCNLFEILEPN
jgi:hypothetical protein